MSAPLVLVVDDDLVLRDRLARAFRHRGFRTAVAADAEEALERARQEPPDRAVIDLKMPGRSGLELIAELVAEHPDCRAVMLTGYGSIPTAIDAIRLGAVYYVTKPADADEILAAFERGDAPPLSAADQAYEAPSLARSEWEHIQRVLADCGGNISEAARRLGLHRRTLQRKLQKYPPRT